MIGIQMLSARIGWVTGEGLAANIDKTFPRWLTTSLVGLLVVANTINIAAEIGAMGEAARLILGGPLAGYVVGFGALCTLTGYLELDPIKALVWSAIVNGVISLPIMAALMWIGQSQKLMGSHTITTRHRLFSWSATAIMAIAVVVMFATGIWDAGAQRRDS